MGSRRGQGKQEKGFTVYVLPLSTLFVAVTAPMVDSASLSLSAAAAQYVAASFAHYKIVTFSAGTSPCSACQCSGMPFSSSPAASVWL